jgi:hypothetical protein
LKVTRTQVRGKFPALGLWEHDPNDFPRVAIDATDRIDKNTGRSRDTVVEKLVLFHYAMVVLASKYGSQKRSMGQEQAFPLVPRHDGQSE